MSESPPGSPGPTKLETGPGDSPDPYEELLAHHGMKTDDDIRRYLEQLHPGPDAESQAALLIRQLGDDDFFKR